MIAQFFKRIWNVLTVPWVLALAIALLFMLVVWFVGPLVAIAGHTVLESVVARLIASLIIVFCWGLFVALSFSHRRRQEQASPEASLAAARAAEEKERQRDAQRSIRQLLQQAIRTATSSQFYGARGKSRYDLPWYLVLGTTNSGKTSALLNSGLKFPLNEQADRHLHRIEATEQCTILYSNDALFIDTPGNYTESAVHTPAQNNWILLLRRLFAERPAQPLNGIILCVSMRDIIEDDAPRREHLARTLRTRLSEALKYLRSSIPVYLLFTKCDAVPGFAQFFASLSRAEKEQLFGCPLTEEELSAGGIRTELKNLMHTLNAQIITRMHQERDLPARGELFRFPQEMAGLASRIEEFASETFGPSRYHRPVMFRGFFFSSALSAGDLNASLARAGELSYQTGFHAAFGDYARGFFLLRFLEDLVIPEARLANTDREQIWALRFRRYGIQCAAVAFFLFAGAFMGVSFINNYDRVDAIASSYEQFSQARSKAAAHQDTRSVLPELALLEQARAVYKPAQDSFLAYGLGLYQGRAFDRAIGSAYLGELNNRLLPPLRAAAARQVELSLASPPELKSALRAYLMLCLPQHINRNFLDAWLARFWSAEYSGQAPVQEALQRHADYLMTHGMTATTPDSALVEKARKALLRIPIADLAYQQLQEEAAESSKPPFTFRAALGQTPFLGDTHRVDYLYTRQGYEEFLVRRCSEIIRNLTGDTWIFGNNPVLLSAVDMDTAYREVRVLYFRDYTRAWSTALKKLRMPMPSTMPNAAKLAEEMTSGVSPVVLVLRELRKNTRLILENVDSSAVETAATSQASRKLQQKLASKTGDQTARSLTASARNKAEKLRRKAEEEARRDALMVRQYFVSLDSLLDEQGNPGPALQAAQDTMKAAGEYFMPLAPAEPGEQRIIRALLELADDKNDTLHRLEQAASRLPSPVREWYSTVIPAGLRGMLIRGSRAIDQAYQEKVIGVYEKTLQSRYPFNASAGRDVDLSDFTAFFRAGGILDSFYETHLQPFIARNGTLRPIMGRYMPLSSQAVVRLQRAQRIQEAFFTSGRETGVSFLMEPYALDASLKAVELRTAGKTLRYMHGPVQGASFSWPAEAAPQAVLKFTDLHDISTQLETRGEWALFRLLRAGKVKKHDGNTCLIEITHQGKWAQFLIQFRSKYNPFDPRICSFSLPDTLL